MVYYQNVRGLRTKLNSLQHAALTSDYDVLVLTETWLSGDFLDAELGLVNYTVYRKDRSEATSVHRRGGGVLIAVHENIKSSQIEVSPEIEQLFVTVGTGNRKCIIGGLYAPPRSPVSVYMTLSETMDEIANGFPGMKVSIFGDFNLPNAHWTTDNLASTAISDVNAPGLEAEATELVSNMCAFHNFIQKNTIHNDHGGLLDLVLSQHQELSVAVSEEPLLQPDVYHPPLEISIEFLSHSNNPGLNSEGFYRDFNNADYHSIIEFLSCIDWDNLFKDKSLDLILNIFYDHLYQAINLFVPLKKHIITKVSSLVFSRIKTPNHN